MDDYRGLIPDPHLPPQTIFFDDTVIAGITPMQRGKPYDEIIDRPRGMKGYILNLTIEGEGYRMRQCFAGGAVTAVMLTGLLMSLRTLKR